MIENRKLVQDRIVSYIIVNVCVFRRAK